MHNDRARTIAAPPSDVWPWIAQLGQDKAGFYSYKLLGDALGCRMAATDRVHERWQDVRVGDDLRLHPQIALLLAHVDPGRSLVASSLGGTAPKEMGFDFTWAFDLSPTLCADGRPGTRLHLRERYRTRGAGTRLIIEASSLASAIMTRRMTSRLATLSTRG